MKLRLYDTLTREKRDFVPLDPARVRMYVCGPTVYDFAHIGNARPLIVFDVLYRLLRHLYGADRVTYVRNVTDVDDKINARAAERGVSIRELTEETYRNFRDDVAALGCLPPTYEPRATEYVDNPAAACDMIRLIERLIANGNAYAADGHVLFAVGTMPDYGRLARRSLDEMIAGARVEVAPYKRDAMDFVLWKPSPPELPGWESPWGRGRPGWHIECSAMAAALLGETFDIHGGGIDLVFPHHENEIAQSRCAFHSDRMANFWMHNGFLQVEGEKMSKSLGNFVTIRELLERGWDGRVIRFAMLRTHYRQPINWTVDGLTKAALELHTFSRHVPEAQRFKSDSTENPVLDALCDDVNTPKAITELFGIVNALHRRTVSDDILESDYSRLWLGLDLLGLSNIRDFDPNQMFSRIYGIESRRPMIESLIKRRLAARKAKDFSEADRIRDELAAMGVVLKDGKDPVTGEPVTTWEIAR